VLLLTIELDDCKKNRKITTMNQTRVLCFALLLHTLPLFIQSGILIRK